MRRALIAAAGGVLLLAGCSSSGGGGASSSPAGPPTSGPAADRVFLAVVRPDFPDTVTDGELVTLAHNMCGDFDRHVEWVKEVALMIHQGGVPAKVAGGFIAAAVETYCPRNASALPH